MVDEADLDPMGTVRGSGGGGGAGGKRGAESPRTLPPKRKVGPLPHHVVARRPSSPAPPSPVVRTPLPVVRAPLPVVRTPLPVVPPSPVVRVPVSPQSPIAPAAPLSPVTTRRPASPLAPAHSDLPSGRPPEVIYLHQLLMLLVL